MIRPVTTGRAPLTRAKSVAEFCASYGISRTTLENWAKRGIAPDIVQPIPRGRKLITAEAEAAWRARFSSLATAITDAAE
jgi:hypothetical protein